MQAKYKILVSAYACSPTMGSEPGMGWNFVVGLSRYHHVHVITEQVKWKDTIVRELKKYPELQKNLSFYYLPKKRNKFLRKIWPPSYYWYYRKWQKKAYVLAKKLEKKENFDIIHQLNMVGFREPGYLWKIDKPFVWGPIGGMELTPWHFIPSLGIYGLIYFTARNIINFLQLNLLTRPRKAASRKNSKLIAATPDTNKKINQYFKKESIIVPEVGILKSNLSTMINERKPDQPLKIVWAGLHIPRKGLNFLLKALAELSDLQCEVHVLGSGPYTKKWKQMAKMLGIDSRIRWYGWKSKDETIDIMTSGHIFSITSMLDLTSTVTLEALSAGLPIICPDHYGYSYIVNEKCGIKVPVTNPHEFVNNYALAIKELYQDENRRKMLGIGAINRAAEFTWENKIDVLNSIYDTLTSEFGA